MRTIETLMASPAIDRIGWALVHSLWQSTAVALVLAVFLRRLRRAPAEGRYMAACAALLLMVTLPAATSAVLSPAPGLRDVAGSTAPAYRPGTIDIEAGQFATPNPRSFPHLPGRLRGVLPAMAATWMVGIVVLSLRTLGGWLLARRLAHHHARSVAHAADMTLARLSRIMRIGRSVFLRESPLVQVPVVIGAFRPVILLPIAALTGLAPAQLEVLLAHELAHIRRHDYVVNLVQTAIDVLLFYHPAAWWVSRVIRAEREHCCDDLAVRACGDRLTYARALAAMEGLRGAPYLSLAVTGSPLLGRVRRILEIEGESMDRLPIVASGAALLIGSLFLASGNAGQTERAREPRSETRFSSVYGPSLRTVQVPLFRSVSFGRALQLQLTELVIKEIERRTPYKVVGHIEEADTIIEGTVNLTENGAIVIDRSSVTGKRAARIETRINWTHNPPWEEERGASPVILGQAIDFVPRADGDSLAASFPVCQALARQIVDAMERLASRECPADPTTRGGVQSSTQDPPSEAEVWREVTRFDGGAPSTRPRRSNARFLIEKIGEKIDPCKVHPPAGPCERIHRFYKCTVTFDEWRPSDEPGSFARPARHCVEVIYLDRDFLRRCAKTADRP